ncbi:family 10 glycosylhydrolase [Anaeromassilibacillus sp. SJQ-1]|uniref:family 10 glycosylhydrolase n=1 Tax=Anaeromassilibacillus sp. SJQ-1 TaxID=3375419 RepID=UPI00398929A1
MHWLSMCVHLETPCIHRNIIHGHILSGGTQGRDPGYDPLEYMVEATHKAEMEFHAWLNPMRIQSGGDTPSTLAENNNYNVWQGDSSKAGWTVQTASG